MSYDIENWLRIQDKEGVVDMGDTVSESVREIRLALGLTQEQFAVKLGVTFPTVNRWENLKTSPSPLALQKLQKLHVNLRKKGLLQNSDNVDLANKQI